MLGVIYRPRFSTDVVPPSCACPADSAPGTACRDSRHLTAGPRSGPGHQAFPADLVRLYHERWEIESAPLALRHTLLNGRVLRSGDRPGVEQELWSPLSFCQFLPRAMVTAVGTRPGTDPDRASFTTALEAAREELTAARGITPSDRADLPGVIGRTVLATLLPVRRARFSARSGQVRHLPLPQPRRRTARRRRRNQHLSSGRHCPTAARPGSTAEPPRGWARDCQPDAP